MLQIPPTIRLPRPDELPNNPEVFERLKKRENANIVQGYVIHANDTQDNSFKFYAEININNSELAELFLSLLKLLPDQVFCVYNLYQEEPNFSRPLDQETLALVFKSFQLELTQDCNIEFGSVFQSDNELIEVFISDSKFVKFWGIDEAAFRQVMHTFQIPEIPNLNFVDEFPKVVEPLTLHNDKARGSELVIQELSNIFNLNF